MVIIQSLTGNGEQAVEVFTGSLDSDSPIDAVILDMTISGGMGGMETAKRLLEIDPSVKIIVATGYSNDPVMSQYKDYGMTAALPKPFDLHSLRQVLKIVLGK